jgi:hypothetical protein
MILSLYMFCSYKRRRQSSAYLGLIPRAHQIPPPLKYKLELLMGKIDYFGDNRLDCYSLIQKSICSLYFGFVSRWILVPYVPY